MASPFFPDHPYLPQNDAFQSQNALLAAQMVLAHGGGGGGGDAVPLPVPPVDHCGGAMVAHSQAGGGQAACASVPPQKAPHAAAVEERPGTSRQHDADEKCGGGAGAKRRRRAERSNGVKAPVDPPLLHCEHCNYTTKGEYRLQQHVERKHESNAVILVHCGKCQYECNSLLDMKTHKAACDAQAKAADLTKADAAAVPVSPQKTPAASVPPQRYYCTGCGFWTSEEATLSAHIEIAHAFDDEPVVFQCPRCSYSCGRRSAWEAHATLAHGNESGLIEPLVKYKKHSLDGDEDIRRYKAGEKAKRARRARRGRVTVIKADLLSPVQCDKLRRVARRRAARATSAIGVSDSADGEVTDDRALFEEPSITRRGRWLYCDLCGTRSDDVQEILGHVHQEHGAQAAADGQHPAHSSHGGDAETAGGGESASLAHKHVDGEPAVEGADELQPGDSTDAAAEEQSLFQCDYCNYHTMHEGNIKVHVLTHFQKSSHNYKRLKHGAASNGVKAGRARSKKATLEENGNDTPDHDGDDEEKSGAEQRCDDADAHSDTARNNAAELHGVDVKVEAV